MNGDGQVERCEDECCAPTVRANKFLRGLRHGFVNMPRDIGKWLVIGLVQMLVMTALGIPVYVWATASVSIATALIAKGVSPGAAFAFLVTGPATDAATILPLGKLLG